MVMGQVVGRTLNNVPYLHGICREIWGRDGAVQSLCRNSPVCRTNKQKNRIEESAMSSSFDTILSHMADALYAFTLRNIIARAENCSYIISADATPPNPQTFNFRISHTTFTSRTTTYGPVTMVSILGCNRKVEKD